MSEFNEVEQLDTSMNKLEDIMFNNIQEVEESNRFLSSVVYISQEEAINAIRGMIIEFSFDMFTTDDLLAIQNIEKALVYKLKHQLNRLSNDCVSKDETTKEELPVQNVVDVCDKEFSDSSCEFIDRSFMESIYMKYLRKKS